ncbi:hypothetical protein RFI_39375, partial [Reticulomyxa filosa]
DDDDDDKQKEQKQDITTFKYNKSCRNMLSFVQSSHLKNGVDFLLMIENNQQRNLKDNEWNNYNFGIFLLGENIILTSNSEKEKEKFGHLKIKTSHLWIKHSSSKIDCSQLGYPCNQGPGKGKCSREGGGGGYGTKGEGNDDDGT